MSTNHKNFPVNWATLKKHKIENQVAGFIHTYSWYKHSQRQLSPARPFQSRRTADNARKRGNRNWNDLVVSAAPDEYAVECRFSLYFGSSGSSCRGCVTAVGHCHITSRRSATGSRTCSRCPCMFSRRVLARLRLLVLYAGHVNNAGKICSCLTVCTFGNETLWVIYVNVTTALFTDDNTNITIFTSCPAIHCLQKWCNDFWISIHGIQIKYFLCVINCVVLRHCLFAFIS